MAVRQRRRMTDAAQNIKEAVGRVFSCGGFFASKFSLPAEKGAQLSMTGDIVAVGNGGTFYENSLAITLKTFPSMWKSRDADLARFISRRRFTVLCGECDRSVAMLGAIAEMVKNGVEKIVIAADTPVERDNITDSLELMRAGLGETAITTYKTKSYDATASYKAYASIYGYLTSNKPEVLVLSRDSFSRKSNILRRKSVETTDGKCSLTDLIRGARPVVLVSAVTVDGCRNIAKNAAVFDPAATVLFAGEDRNLRDCVIYRPDRTAKKQRELPEVPEQIGF